MKELSSSFFCEWNERALKGGSGKVFPQTEFIMCDVHDLLLVSCWKMRVLKQNSSWTKRNVLCEKPLCFNL